MTSDVVLPCGQLRVVFHKLSDRIGHRVEVLNGGIWVSVLESLEGSESDDWPTSPPLQTLHVEERPEGQVALLVGMAGRSHWSASVAAGVAESRMTFDIACRVSGDPGWLGSSYRWLLGNGDLLRQRIQITPVAALLKSTDESTVVVQSPPVLGLPSRTVRWIFGIQVIA